MDLKKELVAGRTLLKEKSKYSGHRHRPARNPVKGDSSDEETAPASPGRRITRGMDPREARRERCVYDVDQNQNVPMFKFYCILPLLTRTHRAYDTLPLPLLGHIAPIL